MRIRDALQAVPEQKSAGARRWYALSLCALLCAAPFPTWAAPPVPPPPSDKIFRIAYVETERYWGFGNTFEKIRSHLDRLGWGEAIVFPPELHYDLEEEAAKRPEPEASQAFMRDLFAQGGFDLLLSFGSVATQTALTVNPGQPPIVGISIADPLAAHIVKSSTDSGVDNFTTALSPASGTVMIPALQQIVRFEKLGLPYSDTPLGRLFAFVDDNIEVARENGLKIIAYPHLSSLERVEECLDAVKDLYARGAEFIFFGELRCVDMENSDPAPIFRFLEEKNIPSFAVNNRPLVKNFATMGIINFNDDEMADLQARQIIRILSGEKPRNIPMMTSFNFRLLVNLEAIRKRGITLPLEILLNVDEIYMTHLDDE